MVSRYQTKEPVHCFMQHCAPTHHPAHQHHGHHQHHPQHHHQAHHPAPPHLNHHPHHPHHPAQHHHQSHHHNHHHASPTGPPPSALHAPPPLQPQQPPQSQPNPSQQQQAQQQPQLAPFRIAAAAAAAAVAAARSDTYFTNYHQGRSIHSGPPPPPHHTGVLPGVVTGANVITQGGGGGVGGGGGGPAQAPTPPGASPHDMAKQGGGPPTQAAHVGAHSQMPGASTFSMNYTISNSQRHSGPQTQYFRTPNQQRMATNPRSQVMNSNGMPTIGFPQITSFPVPQVHFMQHQWVSHRQPPGYPFSASAQTPVMFQSVYPYVSNQSQSHYMMGPLRPPAAGASTGGGGHGGTPPQQQPIQQQSPVPLQQQTVMGAGGSPAGGISLGGGGGPSGHAVGVYQPVPLGTMVNMGGNVGQPTVQNKSKPRLHALPIVDPVTGKNVVNEMLKSEENSGATSDSPARTEKEEKIAEFSSKIGKAAASSSETDVSPPQPQPSETSGEGTMPQISGAMNGPSENLYSIPSENVGLSQLGMNVSSEPWKQTSEKERDPTVEPSICDTVNQKTVVDYVAAAKLETVMEEPESSPVVQTLALNQFEGQQTPVVSARGGGVRVPSPVAANVPVVKQQQPAPIVSPLPVNQPIEAMPLPSMSAKPHPQAQAAKEVTREFPAKHQVAGSKSLQTSAHKPAHAVAAAGEGNEPMVTKKVTPTSREGSSERKKITEVVPKEEDEKKEEKSVEPVIPTPVEEPLPQRQPPQANGDESIDGKPTQRSKTKKVHKNRELNRKGAEKEGTDMDAFSDAQQQQKQEAAAAAAVLTTVNSAASAPVSQRIDTPMQPTIAMDEKVVNETSKSRTLTPPPANQLPPASKTSALPPSVTPKGATVTNNENVPVQLNSNTSNKVESHPPKVPSSKPGNEKNLDNKLSTMEMPPVVPEQNFVSNSKRDEVEKEVSVEKITEDSVKEAAKTDQINENSVESTKVEKDMSTAEKNDKEEEEIVSVRNNENKLSSLPANEKEENSSTKKEQDAEMNSAPGAPAVIENVASETIMSKLIAKNNYREDQWSPINPQGKKKYEREFLLGLQNDPQSVKKPENLPDIDIVLKDNTNRAPSRQVDLKNIAHLSRNSQDFAPCFVKSLAPRPMATKRNSQQGKPKGGSKVVYLTIPSNSDVKLHEAENAWKPRNKQPGKDGRAEQKEAEELYASMRGILNKLTPQNFEKLVQQVMRLPIDTMEKLVGVINLVFDKAVDEPNFSVAYAELCNYLNNADIAKKVKKGDDSSNENFRKILLKRCQKEFEKDKAAEYGLHEKEKEIEKEPNEEKRKEMRLQLEEDERRIRRKSVGVMRFIGELYKLGMINQFIMVTCIKTLLDAGDEESLECLCKLLTTVGKFLEESLEKKMSSGVPNTPNINLYFSKMKTIVSERKTSSRVRFMLQDVIDLRNSKWVPRRNEANPKKIDQINLEAERESMEQSQLTANYSQMSRGSGGMSRRDEKSKGDEWSTVQSKNRIFNVDPHKLKVPDTENVQLGSRSQHSVWCKGATGGSSGMGLEKKQSNLYNMLSDDSGSREGSNRRMPMRHKDSPQSYTKSSSTSSVGISPAEERERALNALRDNARGPQTSMESPRLRGVPPSKTSSRDSSVSEERSLANSKAQKAPAYMSQDALDKLCKMTLDDYLSTNNVKETYDYMKVELPPANYVDFIQFSVEKVLETTTPERQSVSRLLAYLISHQLFNKQLFAKGLNKILACAEELLLDVPMFWSYIADILDVMLEEEVIPLSILPYFTSELPENLRGPLVIAVLNVLNKNKGQSWVNEKWAESGLHWNDLIPAKNVEKFVKDNGLDYIVDGSGHGQSNFMDHVKEKIVFLLKSSGSADAVFDWIEANVQEKTSEPSFIRALTTAVIEIAMENSFKDPVLETTRKILQRYLSSIETHELQCLYAIQALVHDLEHPKGLILKVFEFLHNLDLISVESFVAWERSSDEPDGKAVALKSLTQFFTYLTEPDDDSAEET